MLNYLYGQQLLLKRKIDCADHEDYCTGDVNSWVNAAADIEATIYDIEEALWLSMGCYPLYYCENWDD